MGASGIAGQAVCTRLLADGWRVVGLNRSQTSIAGVETILADLLDPSTIDLGSLDPEVVVYTAWMRRDTEAENIEVNSASLRNLLGALEGRPSLRHVALMTGLKHYLGPFENYGTAVSSDTPFHEDSPRIDTPNFYYAQEDVLFEAARRMGFTWSVHRSHTAFGFALGNAMNMVLTLGVYAEICRETGQPFIFPGSEVQWNGITDAGLLADHILWASTSPEGADEAFNIANGEVFRWRWLWPRLADFLGVQWEGYVEQARPLEPRMSEAAEVWRHIAAREGLVEPDVNRLASWWHTDGDLGRPIECFADMSKSRLKGFDGYATAEASFKKAIDRYREAGILPQP